MSRQPNVNIYRIGGGLIYSDRARPGRDDWADIAAAMACEFHCAASDVAEEETNPEGEEYRMLYVTVCGKRVAYFW
jgi:hypothetical protein